MQHLYVMRHAKAKQTRVADHQRPLRKRGKRQAAAMAPLLEQWQALEGEVYVSTAVRSRATFDGIVEQLPERKEPRQAHFDEALYTFEGDALRAWLKALPGNPEKVFIIGHNPALQELVAWLCKTPVDSLPTGSVLHLTLPDVPSSAIKKGCAVLSKSVTPAAASYPLFQRQQPKPSTRGHADMARRIQGLLAHQYLTIRALEPGVMAGVDPEFLHQYRVNLRRSRAIGESVLAIIEVPGLKKRLKRLKRRAQATSDLRDLDVFLQHLDEAPPAGNLKPFLKPWLQERQQEQHDAICQQLTGADYAWELEDWQAFISSKAFRKALSKKLTPKRIKAVLDERIARHNYDLAALTLEAKDDALHSLRKGVKRIRYLADLDPKSHQHLLSRLKHRQQLLGDFQDLCARQSWLKAFDATSTNDTKQKSASSSDAALNKQKQQLRKEVSALPPLVRTAKG
ncbi:CHAD domain-containing protein [Halomonas sp. LS-001]